MDEYSPPYPVVKESGGSSPVRTLTPFVNISPKGTCQMGYVSQPDNSNKENLDTNTGKSVLRSPRRNLLKELKESSEMESMPNSRVQKQLLRTVTKKRREFPSLLPLEPNPFVVTVPPTGSPYGIHNELTLGPPPSPVNLEPSPPMSEWLIITPSQESGQTTQRRLSLLGKLSSFGVVQVRENHTVLGWKQEKTLTLKTHALNFGAATMIRRILSSMNFGAVLTFPTCSDGSMGTLALWKSKDLPDPLMQREFGSLATSVPLVGTRN